MSSHMASHIHSHRETRNMCGKLFNIYSQSSGMPTKPLRANILCIHSIQHFLLKFCIIRICISEGNGAAESCFGQKCAFFKIAADAYTQNHGWACIPTSQPGCFCHKIYDILFCSRRCKYLHSAHVFTSEPLGSDHQMD